MLDRRSFLLGTSGVVLTAAASQSVLAQEIRRTPHRLTTSLEWPYKLEISTAIQNTIREFSGDNGLRRGVRAGSMLSRLSIPQNFHRARVEAARNIGNRDWLEQTSSRLFENRRARRAFNNWFPNQNNSSSDRALTNVLVFGGADISAPTILSYAAVGHLMGASWEDLTSTLAEVTGDRVSMTKARRLDLSSALSATVARSGRNQITVHLTQAEGGVLRRLRRTQIDNPNKIRKRRGFFQWLKSVLQGAAAGAALGTLAEGGVPGPGTAVGGVMGAIIGASAYAESQYEDNGGGNGFWDSEGCPPEDRADIFC